MCRGNIARSSVAEVVIKKELSKRRLGDRYDVVSRSTQGTSVDPQPVKFPNITYYEDLYREAKPALDQLGIDITSHVSKPIDREVAENASILLAMDKKTQDALLTLFPDLKSKIYMLSKLTGGDEDFVDPERVSGTKRHLRIFSGIQATIIKGLPKLLGLLGD